MTALTHENFGCLSWRLLALMFTLALFPPAQARAAGADPFPACMAETSGDDKTCLARQGDWASWTASEAACRFVGKKVDAIVEAGGQPKWANLFYNERCARLGLPHGPVAAAAGNKATGGTWIVLDHPYAQCVYLDRGNSDNCDDSMGRHAFYPLRPAICEGFSDDLPDYRREHEKPYSLSTSFENERCWRLGYPHFEPD